MPNSPRSLQSPPQLQSALKWLNTRPSDDPIQELSPLHGHLRDTLDAGMPPLQRLKVLELFEARAHLVTAGLKPQLLAATLPLERRLRNISRGLVDTHGLLAAGYLGILRDSDPTQLNQPRRSVATLCAKALTNLALQQEVALLVSAPSPTNLWLQAQAAFHQLRTSTKPDVQLPPEAIRADRLLKSMLALAAAQPESFAAREIAFLVDYLGSFSAAVELRTRLPEPADHWYWLEESRDLPPVAASRRSPPSSGTMLWYSCAILARLAERHLDVLREGQPPEALGLPALSAAEDYRNALARAQTRWAMPPKRHFHRRPNHYRVQICAQFAALWQLLRDAGTAAANSAPITEWMVLNESPGGFGTMHLSGQLEGVVAGSLLGLRNSPAQSWSICLVRWARSDNPEHMELGLELVAPSAIPVRVASGGREGDALPVAALLLPPLAALDRGETLLTGRGQYAGGRFTLLREVEGKLQLTECHARRLVMQTASVELFEFERDYLPG